MSLYEHVNMDKNIFFFYLSREIWIVMDNDNDNNDYNKLYQYKTINDKNNKSNNIHMIVTIIL